MPTEDKLSPLDEYLSEEQLSGFLGLKKTSIDRLRNSEGLPFIKVSMVKRLYSVTDLIQWLESRKITLNKADNATDEGENVIVEV